MTVAAVGRAMSWNLIAKVARFTAAPISYVFIVRMLGERNWGLLNVLRTISGFAFMLVMLGAGNALLKYLPELRVRGGAACFWRSFRPVMLLQLAVWIALLVVVGFSGSMIGGLFSEHSERFTLYLEVAVAFVIFEVMLSLTMNALQSWYETKIMGIVIVVGNVVYLILIILFLRFDWGIMGVLLAGGITNAGMSFLLVPQVRSLIGKGGASAGGAPDFSAVLRFSIPFVVTGLLNEIVWRHSEVIFLGHYHGLISAGYFGLAYRLPQMLLEFVPLAVWPIVMAGTAEAYTRDPANLPRAIDLYYRLLFILVMPVAALGFTFARPLVPLLFGDAMLPAALFTQLFFVVFSYSFLYTPLSMALYVMEKSWVNMIVFGVLAVINVALDLALIPSFGIWGAFVPVAITLLIGVLAFNIVVRRMRPDCRVPFGFVLRCYGAAVPAGLLSFAVARWHSPAAIAVQIPIGVGLLIAGFRWMRVVGEREREMIGKLPIPLRNRIVSLLSPGT